MQRLLIGKSLRRIAEVGKSDWRMLVTICWLPVVLIVGLKMGWHYSLPYPKEWLGRPKYILEIAISVYSILKFFLDAIILVGIYRYLIKDSRFGMKIFQPRTAAIAKRIRSVPFYLSIDKSTLIVAIFLIIGSLVYRLGDHAVREFVVDQMKAGRPDEPFNLWFVWRTVILPLQIWGFLYFAISTQLCLINPYVATARRVTGGKLWQNIIALRKNRLRAFAVQFIIQLCFSLLWMIPLLVAYLIYQDYLTLYLSWIGYISAVMSLPLWFVSSTLVAIFCAESFKLLGVRDESLQQKPRPEEGALAGV